MGRNPTTPHVEKSACPIAFCLDVVGDRWTLLVLRDMFFSQKKYYSQFLESPEAISTNILANRLQRLEQGGLIKKAEASLENPRGAYQLTAKGRDFLSVLVAMIRWGGLHDDKTCMTKPILQRINNDPEGFMAEILAKL